ncbi:MAG TPA: hypothetical protein ENI17_14675 [Pseudomonas xinjiangensis]|uniref:Uncharacterized protein n=2 Tax=root TaxID=1 RepID=A0A7V1FTC5_9GAMM|nr:hypothetical protein [Halopseudomonas xinjiangensis]HEC48852.1 hypothetical protein [Halopseudomonas xinjiangensis]
MRERRRRVPLRGGHSLVVVPHETKARRLRKQGMTFMLLLAIPAAGWLGWDAALRSQQQMVEEYEQMLESRQGLEAELASTLERYHQLEVDLLVARESVNDGRSVISQLEQQLFRLQQDLAAYQGALAPTAMIPGLRIQAFELQATETAGVFRYKVMVSRVGSEAETTQAKLFIDVLGTQNGKKAKKSLSSMTRADDDQGLDLDFRYFQVVPPNSAQAELSLPDGFKPESVHLRAEHDGKKLVEQVFDWTITGVKP